MNRLDSSYSSINDIPIPEKINELLKGDRLVNDAVHNMISFKEEFWKIIDTPEFQRLRDIKQLGPVYSVFSGAVHTRFEHSLGVGYMVQTMMDHFKQTQYRELDIETRDYKNIVVAGLCNDLGQGIYSHLFDRMLIPTLEPNLNWDYKDASVMMLKRLIDNNNIEIDSSDLKMVIEFIRGDSDKVSSIISDQKVWLFDLVSNKKNAIDADKFDYIQRDIYNLGLSRKTFDPNRLIYSCKVSNNQICYHIKNSAQLKELFQQRYNMFKQVYCHKVCQAVSLMFVDALVEVNPYFKFIDNLNNSKEYYNYTDPLIKYVQDQRKKVEFKSAQVILDRITKRDLYKFVGEKLLDTPHYMKIRHKIDLQALINCQKISNLRVEDVSLHQFSINYGRGIQNPVDMIQFYEKTAPINDEEILNFDLQTQPIIQKVPENSYQVNRITLMPNEFSESYIRLFVKDSENQEAAEQAFETYFKKLLSIEPQGKS